MAQTQYDRVLVTGGAGFIGANLVRLLKQHGHDVVVVDNLAIGNKAYLDGLDVELHEKDIRNPEDLSSCFTDVDAVIHLAAYGNVVDSIRSPAENFQINAQGTLNVLDAARFAHVRKFVLASTGGALMGNAPPPVDETSVPQPISPYGASKLAGEGYCSAYAASYGMNTVCCRFGNVYGTYSAHKKGVITRYINQISKGEAITIYGDGDSMRDYIYVDDLCRGIHLALSNDTGAFNIFHLATGKGTRIAELADMIYSFFPDKPRQIHHEPARTGEVDKNFASYTKAMDMLGFEPEVSLRDGLEETIDWFREHVLR
jgi:UDP-glucose 4-epimerase